jgi:ABC-type multidrug transport system fused ATPase/permease subunit
VPAAIEFRDVTFRRPGRSPILDRFSLTVESGEVLALVGRSGAGKTTIL